MDRFTKSYMKDGLVSLLHAGFLPEPSAAFGIARQINESNRAISPRQLSVAIDYVERFCGEHQCSVCGCRIEMNDIEPYFDSGMCGYHSYSMGGNN